MKHISALKTLLSFSILMFLFSCKIERKADFSLEETRTRESTIIINLLETAKAQISKNELKKAMITLDSIIDNYGTYDAVEDAYALMDETRNKYMIEKILVLKDIDSLMALITDYDTEIITKSAEKRINDLVLSTNDPKVLQDFLDSNQMYHLRPEAKRRQNVLLEQRKDELFAEARQKNDAQTWKRFLEMYPDHSMKKEIEDNIIGLEVDEIFSGNYGEIPISNQLGATNYVNSELEIKNNTPYTLTLRYSGPENRRIIISPDGSQTINLKSGDYRVTASVNAARVTNYAGFESINGRYSSSYRIVN